MPARRFSTKEAAIVTTEKERAAAITLYSLILTTMRRPHRLIIHNRLVVKHRTILKRSNTDPTLCPYERPLTRISAPRINPRPMHHPLQIIPLRR